MQKRLPKTITFLNALRKATPELAGMRSIAAQAIQIPNAKTSAHSASLKKPAAKANFDESDGRNPSIGAERFAAS
jgi:hypothetical protein